MPTLDLYNPTGATEITRVHAPRLDTLEGKTIGFVSNDSWQAHRTLALLRELLQGRFPTAKIVPFSEFPMGNSHIDSEATADLVQEKQLDAVIVGNAA